MNECDRIPVGHLRSICEGTTGLPLDKVNAYRERWGLRPLAEIATVPATASQRPSSAVVARSGTQVARRVGGGCRSCGGRKQAQPTSIPRTDGFGPGSKLLAIYEAAGMPHCEECLKLAARMDEWGVAGCRKRLREIVDDILPRAKEWVAEHKPWMHRLAAGVGIESTALRLAINRDVRRAIASSEAEQKQRLRTPQANMAAVRPFLAVADRELTWKTDGRLADELLGKTTIIVKSFKRLEGLAAFIGSIRRIYPSIPVCIVDDSFRRGETSELADSIAKTPYVDWVSLPYDSGLCTGRNAAVKHCTSEYIILCDDDFIFDKHTDLVAMLIPLEKLGLDICGGLVRRDGKTASNWCGSLTWRTEKNGKSTLGMVALRTPVQLVAGIRVRRTDVTYNFFAARRQFLLDHPWDDRYKISQEHIDSFITWSRAKAKVGFTVDSVAGHSRKYDTPEYTRLRRRNFSKHFLAKWGLSSRRLLSVTRFPGF